MIIIKKVGGYLRLSDEDRFKLKETDDSESIRNQRDLLVEFVGNNPEWEIFDIYVDDDVSGASNNRPAFKQLLKDCEEGKIDIVICKSQSRFTRTMEEVESILHNKFIEWGIRFIGIVDHADTEVKGNKKARQINGLVNEWYLEDGSENIRSALDIKRKNGKFTGSFAPYGYLIDPNDKNHLIPDPVASLVVKEIFDKYVDGFGYYKICKYLNDKKIPSPYQHKLLLGSKFVCGNAKDKMTYWNNDTIAMIVRNEVYLGKLLQKKRISLSYKNKKKHLQSRDKWIIVDNTHEAIIDRSIWNAVQSRLSQHHRVKSDGIIHKFSRKVYCETCGKIYTKCNYHVASGKKAYLRCGSRRKGGINCTNNSISYDLLEEIVLNSFKEKVKTYLESSELNANLTELIKLEDYNNKKESLQIERKNIEKELDKQHYYYKGLYEDKRDGIITIEEFMRLKKDYNSEIEKMNSRLVIISSEMEKYQTIKDNMINAGTLIKKYKDIKVLSREVIELFIVKILVGEIDKETRKRNVTIEWNFF